MRSDQSYEQQLESARTHRHHIPYLNLDDMVTVFERYNEVIREYSDRENVVVIETDVALEATSENFFDSVHLTDVGSQRLGKHIANRLVQSSVLN